MRQYCGFGWNARRSLFNSSRQRSACLIFSISGDRSQVTYDYHFPTGTVVINPPGGPAESRVIERESLAQCFEDGMALAESLDAEDWPHVTMTEIWGSHAPNGSACSYS